MTAVSSSQQCDDEVSTEEASFSQKESSEIVDSTLTTLEPSTKRRKGNLKHCWSQPMGNSFKVRGLNYLKDKKKFDSGENLFVARGVDLFMTPKGISGPEAVGRHPEVLGGALREKPTFIVNFRFPWGVLVLYFEIPGQYLPMMRKKYGYEKEDDEAIDPDILPPHDKAIHSFIMGDEEFRNSRLKLIPRVVEGNLVVRKLIGKPVLIGKKLPVTYVYEPEDAKAGKCEYLEVDLDIGNSSKKAKKIVGVLQKYIRSLTVDIGFVIEGASGEHLPERMLACARIHHVDPNKSSTITYI